MSDLPSGIVTFLFTDIEGSTKLLHELGTGGYAGALAEHRRILREAFDRHGGVEIDTAGDGFFARFDGPARAIRCAKAIAESVQPLGIDVRAGLHAGECELIDRKIGGIAVHIGARVAAEAGPEKWSSHKRQKTSSPAPGSNSKSAETHNSRASRASGDYMRSRDLSPPPPDRLVSPFHQTRQSLAERRERFADVTELPLLVADKRRSERRFRCGHFRRTSARCQRSSVRGVTKSTPGDDARQVSGARTRGAA